MSELIIQNVEEINDEIGEFLNKEFTDYAVKCEVGLNFDEFCFVAEDKTGKIAGAITGRAYYNEVHVADLIVAEEYRRTGLGSRLVASVEDYFSGKGYDIITLTTFGFQAPGFYKKLGFSVEFVRENPDEKLTKYFLVKKIK